ncbi:MAG: hypothetical protein DMD36_04315, partial [Gemmatimonadetes bacterium]
MVATGTRSGPGHSPPAGAEWCCCEGTPRAWWSSPTPCGYGSSEKAGRAQRGRLGSRERVAPPQPSGSK